MTQFDDFAPIAQEFCAFVETADALDRDELLRRLERHLVALYGAALELPSTIRTTLRMTASRNGSPASSSNGRRSRSVFLESSVTTSTTG
jgi:hypothetical protein